MGSTPRGSLASFFQSETNPNVPVQISKDKQYLMYCENSNLVIRSMKSLATFKLLTNLQELEAPDVSSSSILSADISIDHKMLAIHSKETNSVRILNLKTENETIIKHTVFEEIRQVEWLKVSKTHGNDYILVVYSSDSLSIKFYLISDSSLSVECIHIIYKYASQLIEHPVYENHYSLVLKDGISNKIFAMSVVGNQVVGLNEFETKDNSGDVVLKPSPLNGWLLVWNSLASELDVAIYNFLGLGQSPVDRRHAEYGFAFQRLVSDRFPLGLVKVEWGVVDAENNEEVIICGDHNENLALISMKGKLQVCALLQHKSLLKDPSYDVFELNSSKFAYERKSSNLLKLPKINEDMPLFEKGFRFLELSQRELGSKFVTVTESMPSVLFLWDLKCPNQPILVLNCQSAIQSVSIGSQHIAKSNSDFVNNVIDNLVVVNNGYNITLYCSKLMSVPVVIDLRLESKILSTFLVDIYLENGEVHLKLCCWSKREVRIFTLSLSRASELLMEQDATINSVKRQFPSSAGVDETDTNVRNLIGGVQQSDWTLDEPTGGDTFALRKEKHKKRKFATGKENVYIK